MIDFITGITKAFYDGLKILSKALWVTIGFILKLIWELLRIFDREVQRGIDDVSKQRDKK